MPRQTPVLHAMRSCRLAWRVGADMRLEVSLLVPSSDVHDDAVDRGDRHCDAHHALHVRGHWTITTTPQGGSRSAARKLREGTLTGHLVLADALAPAADATGMLPRDAGSGSSGDACDDFRVELALGLDAAASVPCFLEVLRAARSPLVLTDLPARLGLGGGTYVLDGVPALSACDAASR